jgi:hypothetical protein
LAQTAIASAGISDTKGGNRMNSDLQAQTDLIVKSLTTLHNDVQQLNWSLMILGVATFALLLIIAFRRYK